MEQPVEGSTVVEQPVKVVTVTIFEEEEKIVEPTKAS